MNIKKSSSDLFCEGSERPQIVLYTRPYCGLCHEAKESMENSEWGGKYDLLEININDFPELAQAYGHDIPVVFINGFKAFKHRVSEVDFCRMVSRLQSHKNLKFDPLSA